MNANRNQRLFSSRYRQIIGVILILVLILGVRLFVVTILQHDRWSAEASDQNTKVITTAAPRGISTTGTACCWPATSRCSPSTSTPAL